MLTRPVLQQHLPPTIFVRVYDKKIHLMRAAIVGAAGTPYHDGLFFFDIAFGPFYPWEPPEVSYHSFGLQINPNLDKPSQHLDRSASYARWDPHKTTILQVLVSLQGLVLNEKPYYNDNTIPLCVNDNASLKYNERTFRLSCKTMLRLINKPPNGFKALVATHFKEKANTVLAACDAYVNDQVQVGYYGDITDVPPRHQGSSSWMFKLIIVTVIRPQLVAAFRKCAAQVEQHLVNDDHTPAETMLSRLKVGLARLLQWVCM